MNAIKMYTGFNYEYLRFPYKKHKICVSFDFLRIRSLATRYKSYKTYLNESKQQAPIVVKHTELCSVATLNKGSDKVILQDLLA